MRPGGIAAIITCHDLGRSLPAAIESVQRQTRPASEVVVVDDASTDVYTQQILAGIERGGTRVVQAGGRGVSAARNYGASLTGAEYLVWLDADDTLEPTYFEAAGTPLDRDPGLDFVSCAMRAFGAASYVWTPSPPTFVASVSTGGVPHASTMLRRRLWEMIGGFDEGLRSFELLDFWASVMEQGFRGLILDAPLLNYCVRPASGYRRSIQPATYQSRLGHFYAKHRAAVEHHGLELIQAKEAFLLSQKAYRETLEARTASLEVELTELGTEIAEITRLLESRGSARVDWGDLRRVQPLSQQWGRDRGTPVDRRYIESFLDAHRGDIRGRVLEVRDSTYTRRFGGDGVTTADVVDRNPANERATIVADLRRADAIPTATYDCIILTQTLQLIDDPAAVLAECFRILRPGGVLLATAPCVIRVDDEAGPDRDFWRLTEASARQLVAAAFPIDAFDVTVYGNVMACTGFLYGVAAEEMAPADLDHTDPRFPVVIAIRAVKPRETVRVSQRSRSFPAAILAYHRVAELTPDAHALCTPPGVFRQHMELVRRHFSPIGLDDLVRAAIEGRIPEAAVAVTLDDGYLDALTDASPILVELGVPATFFVNTDRLDEEHERWWDVLEGLFSSESPLPSMLVLKGWTDGQDLQLPTATPEQRAGALEYVNRMAWPLDEVARQTLVRQILTWSGSNPLPRTTHRVLTGGEIRRLGNRPGHSVGAHTTHHLALATQPAGTKRREILDNKATLEDLLQRPIEVFSYPYGEYDADTLTAVREAGFRAAVTVQPGLVAAGGQRLLLPRYEITPLHHGRFADHLREIFEA